jgi:hypothetical protein
MKTGRRSRRRKLPADLLGLGREPPCLDFHKTERPVFTANSWQVRQPIDTRSIGQGRHYRRRLAPLLEVLAQACD